MATTEPSRDPKDHSISSDEAAISRRTLLAGAAGVLGAGVVGRFPPRTVVDAAQAGTRATETPAAGVQASTPAEGVRTPGPFPSELGRRSPFERPRRLVRAPAISSSSRAPLQDFDGIITPSDLHFERHHSGVPEIDPQHYTLLIHGLVERPMVFTLDDLKRYPRDSRLMFLECSGNGSAGFRGRRPEATPQQVDGLTSTSEWTGVPLSTLFREVGILPEATWFLAEGGDAALMSRSIPVEKAWDDALIAYGQNGEALRPEQGYPARLFLPGWEGNANVKWLRRIELSDRPFMTREETSKYTDPLAGGRARQFSFIMDAKSVITFPAYPAVLEEPGWWEISGIAWSGRGRIDRVEVSADGGSTWRVAELQDPVLPKCHTRFRHLWRWNGDPAVLMSRATDETGYTQPTAAELREARGPGTVYHFNHIRTWEVRPDGSVVFGAEGIA